MTIIAVLLFLYATVMAVVSYSTDLWIFSVISVVSYVLACYEWSLSIENGESE